MMSNVHICHKGVQLVTFIINVLKNGMWKAYVVKCVFTRHNWLYQINSCWANLMRIDIVKFAIHNLFYAIKMQGTSWETKGMMIKLTLLHNQYQMPT